ncbi:MAG: DUF3575 domain-containing protein [Bacteroides graminisolvens]
MIINLSSIDEEPNIRFWFRERFSGSFLGIHAHAGIFNVGGVDMPSVYGPN